MLLAFASLALGGSGAAQGQAGLTRFTFTEYLMGEDARIVVYAPSKAVAADACRAAFERLADLDAIMSDYRKDSELMRLCDKAGGPPVPVSSELSKVFRTAARISEESGGAFDITVGPLVKLWRSARKTHKLPSAGEIQAAKRLVDWRKVHLSGDGRTVRLDLKGMRLDLGAIGKGYAADEAMRVLKAHGIERGMVDIGDIVMSGPPPGKQGWAIEVPHEGSTLLLHHCAVSTSGDTEQFVVIGGKRYSHVVNPHTGMALTNRTEATIVAPIGLLSDPLSTACTILGDAQRQKLLDKHPDVTNCFVFTNKL